MEIDKTSYIVALSVFIICTILFSFETGMLLKSAGAALICAGLVWVSYVAVRWLILALKK